MPMVLDPAIAGADTSLSASYVATVLPELGRHYGFDPQVLLARAGLDVSLLERPDALMPLVDVMRLFLEIMTETGDPGLGFEVGRRVRPRSYQVLGYVILSSRTLGEAIQRLVRYEKLAGNLGRTERTEHEGIVRLQWHCPLGGAPGRYITEAAVTGWVAFARQLVADTPSPLAVYFSHWEPARPERYQAYFGCPVHFGAPFSGVEFSASWEALPLLSADPGLSRMMEREARELLQDYDASLNVTSAVRSAIYHRLASGEPSVEGVAADLGLAVRTLQSRLKRQGASFQELLDGLRRSLADIYLGDPALSLTSIAFLLGFSEQSSFTRAFRRWRNMSPAEYRSRRSSEQSPP